MQSAANPGIININTSPIDDVKNCLVREALLNKKSTGLDVLLDQFWAKRLYIS